MGFPVPSEYKWNDDASTTVIYNDETELDGLPNPKLVEPVEPSGTKEITITENGTTTEDVAEYASAEITVDVEGGGSTLTTKTITENGTYNASSDEADGYSSVTVNVPQPSGTKQISITQNGTTTENVAVYASAEITVNVPIGSTDEEIAMGTKPSGSVHIDLGAHNVAQYGLANRAGITSLNLKCANMDTSAMENCTGLITAVINKTGNTRSGSAFLKGCTSLETVDFVYFKSQFAQNCFQNCSSFNKLIIRNDDAIPSLWGGVGNFNGTPFASGGSGGTIYVPNSMISAYQSDTNWGTIIGYTNNSIQAIEGSAYESYYADGTPV